MSKYLVAYFSASGRTAKAAKLLAEAAGADLYEIKPAVPYTRADLSWINKKSRSSLEMKDKSCRPELADSDAGVEKYDAVFADFDRIIGLDRLYAFHLNDSVKGLGSKVDRHAHIGRGALGLEPFRLIVNDPRFAELPMYLETPKGETDEGDWDVVNLKTLQDLIK